ncbi:MAG: Sapep family Mn(2+)-dependent dipeptidase [Tractidigestivibacter sp.]|jgi:predicted dipeptidase|uniref:Sapep family Mn(2+)-dependent dipeptidase n=1 Tax=Tractidigestivibacter sp. TaxID=2847320 RepID=UPI003D9145DE
MEQQNDAELKQRVDAYVDEVWEDVIADIRSLVRIESVFDPTAAEPGKPFGPKSNEALVQAEKIAERLGLEVTDVDGYLGFGDVPGESEGCLATIAHSDVVPIGLGWTVNPLEVTRRDGYLLGRGVIDDKGPLTISLWAAHFFALEAERTGKRMPYTLRCIIGNDEETEMKDVEVYLKRYGEPLFCFSPDADFPLICGEKGRIAGSFASPAVAGEKIVELDGGTVPNAIPGQATALVRADAATLPARENIAVEDAGDGLARVVATGKGGHASLPEGTVNAIGLLARYLLDAGVCGEGERQFLELERTLTEDYDGTTLGVASSDDKFGPLTLIAGTVRTTGNRFVQTIDSRYPTSTTGDAIADKLSKVAELYGATFGDVSDSVPFYISPDSPEISTLLSTYSEYTGRQAKAMCIGGGTYARHFKRACAFGPHEPANPVPSWVGMEHGPDEGVAEADLKVALKIYIVSIARLMRLSLGE